jgi:hypothetical protein
VLAIIDNAQFPAKNINIIFPRVSDFGHSTSMYSTHAGVLSEVLLSVKIAASTVIALMMAKLKELLHRSENRICADCSAPDPRWA